MMIHKKDYKKREKEITLLDLPLIDIWIWTKEVSLHVYKVNSAFDETIHSVMIR